MWFNKIDGNVIVTIEDVKGRIRRSEHVSKLDQDTWNDQLSIISDDDDTDITSVKMSKVRKITIEIVQ